MSKATKGGKRALAVVLAIAMMLTTLVTFNIGSVIGSAASSAITVTDNAQENVYFYVPEQIYLAPDLNSYSSQGRYSFQWFVDSQIDKSTHLAKPRTGENSSGNFYFYYKNAESITLTFRYLNQDLSDMTAYTSTSQSTTTANYANQNSTIKLKSNSVEMSAVNTRSDVARTRYTVASNTLDTTVETTDSLSPFLVADATGYYIEWTINYVDSTDGVTKAVRAYTFVYKPYVQAVGAAARAVGSHHNVYTSSILWVSGIHGYTNGDSGNLHYTQTANFTPILGLIKIPSNNDPTTNWIQSGSNGILSPTFSYYSISESGVNYHARSNSIGPTALLTVDTSRYTNFNQIPNFRLGFMVTDRENTNDSGTNEWYVSDYGTNNGSSYYNGTARGSSQYTSDWNDSGTKFLSGSDREANIKYNGTWDKSISGTSNYRIKSAVRGMHKKTITSTSWNNNFVNISVTGINKSALRDAYDNATRAAAYLGLTVDGTSPYFEYTSSAWQNYLYLYLSAGQLLANFNTMTSITVLGTSYTFDQLAVALNNAVATVNSARLTSTATARFLALEQTAAGNYVLKEMQNTSARAIIGDETASYKLGNSVSFIAPEFGGYSYVGYVEGTPYASGADLGTSYNGVLSGTGSSLVKNYTTASNLGCTFIYAPEEVSAIVDTNDGTYNFVKTLTSGFPSEIAGAGYPSATARPGVGSDFNYQIEGNDVIAWTTDVNTREQYMFLPFYVETTANTTYRVTYDVAGTDASNVKLSIVSGTFTGGNGASTSEYTAVSGGTFKTNNVDAARAFIKLELTGDARNTKTVRISNICVSYADRNELYLDTTKGYSAVYSASTSDPKTNMNYTTSDVAKAVVTTRYSTLVYEQYQMLPYYIQLKPNCTYKFTYKVSGIDASKVKLSLYSSSFTGGNGSTLNYYEFAGSGSSITVGANDDAIAQLRIDVLDAAASTSITITDLCIENADTKTTIDGSLSQTITLGIPVKEGYKLNGWTLKSNSGGAANGSITSTGNYGIYDYTFGSGIDIIEAEWVPATLKVVFRAEDGTVVSEQNVTYGNAATTPTAEPEKFGHTFAGWDTDYSKVTKNLIIEPLYVEKDIAVTVKADAAEIFAGSTTNVSATFVPNEPEISAVEWTSNNNSIATVDANGVVTGVAAGTATITGTITYDGRTYSASTTVKINAVEVTGIEVNTMPNKTAYFTGETFDPTGLTLTVSYNNGTTAVVSDGMTFNTVNTTLQGTKTVRVTYAGKTATFKITVTELKITSIEIVKLPDTTEYYIGEEDFDATGIVVEAVYNNGSREAIDFDELYFDGFDASAIGENEITVYYEDFEATFNVTIKALDVTSIAIKTAPKKTTYFIGETADYTGLVITATYSNGVTTTVTSGYTVSGFDSATAGQKTITVEYEGKTATFNVTVKAVELESIEIVTPAQKLEYFTGEAADFAGLTIKANYNNGTSAMVDDYTVTGFDSATAGQKTITVAYEGKTVTFNVTVKAIEIVALEIVTPAQKLEYFTGEDADFAGLTVKATYNNGTSAMVDGYTVTGFDSATAGQKTITVAYEGKTVTFDVTVKAIELVSIDISTAPYKTVYFVNEAFDATGLTLTATYNNGTVATITDGYELGAVDMTTAGTKAVAVTYEGKTVNFNITVNALYITDVEIATMPNKTEYIVGEAEDNTGLTLKVTYNDGTTKVVSTGFDVVGFDSTTKGTVTLMVSYEGFYAMYDVTVYGKADFGKIEELYYEILALDSSLYTNYDEVFYMDIYPFYNDTVSLAKSVYVSEKDQPAVDELYNELVGYYNKLVLVAIDSIEVLQAPNKVVYDAGEAFDATGLELFVIYNNGTFDTVTEGFTLSEVDMTTAGTKTVTVTYEGKTATFEITVNAVVVETERFEIVGGASVVKQGGVNYIVGLQPSLTQAKFKSTYIDYENVTIKYNMTTARYMGTGSTVTVTSTITGEVIAEYVIVIYGDVDGTATINARDALAITNSISGVADSLTGAAKLAANVEGTRATINAKDASVIRAVAGGTMVIDQTTGKGVNV